MSTATTPITIVGRVGQSELRQTSGDPVLSFSVAVKREKFNRDTRKYEEVGVDWHRVSQWGKKGEASANQVTKGALVIVTGDLGSRQYDKDGAKVTAWEIKADEVGIIPSIGSSSSSQDAWTNQGGGYPDEAPF